MSFLALTEEDSGDVTGNIMRGSAIGKWPIQDSNSGHLHILCMCIKPKCKSELFD